MGQLRQKTLGIIKPDAVRKHATGKIISMIEECGLEISGLKRTVISASEAEAFYGVHKGKPFYPTLIQFMCSGPSVVVVIEGENAIARWRELMGSTDSTKAAEGTVRKLFGTDMQKNAAHGSDAPETAAKEINFFFSDRELIS